MRAELRDTQRGVRGDEETGRKDCTYTSEERFFPYTKYTYSFGMLHGGWTLHLLTIIMTTINVD